MLRYFEACRSISKTCRGTSSCSRLLVSHVRVSFLSTANHEACSLINLRVGSFFQRVDTAKWTPYLDKCCDLLYEFGHHRHDRFAVALIRMQLVSEKIYQNPWHGSSEGRYSIAPPVLYLKALQNEMKTLRIDLAAEMNGNRKSFKSYSSELRS